MEVSREIRMREQVYPRLIMNGKLTQAEADRRMHAMQNALRMLAAAPPPPPPIK